MNLAVRRALLRWGGQLSSLAVAAAVGTGSVSAQQPLPLNYSSQGPYTSADTTGMVPPPHPDHLPYPGAQGYGQPQAGGFYFEPDRYHPYSRRVTEVLPDDRGGNIETPLDAVLKAMIRRSYIRTEYLHFDISPPGEKILGAPAIAIVDEDGTRLTGVNDTVGDLDGDGYPEGFGVGIITNSIPIAFRELLVEDITLQTPIVGPTTAEVQQLALNATDVLGGRMGTSVAVTPDLSGVDITGLNGIRGTLVIPFDKQELELNVWGLQQFDETLDFSEILTVADFQREVRSLQTLLDLTDIDTLVVGDLLVATTVTQDGLLGEGAILYDESFVATYRTDVWGTEANVVMNSPFPGEGLKFRPTYGFRYLSINELLSHTGVDSVNSRTVNVFSETGNNSYGPQVGLRTELVHRWFTLGVEPKIMLGLNTHSDLVRVTDTNNTASTSEIFTTNQDQTDFSAIFDLSVNAKVHVNEYFSLFASYQLMWNGLITRPASNINYNTTTTGSTLSGIVLNPDLTDLTIQGLTVGGEFHWK